MRRSAVALMAAIVAIGCGTPAKNRRAAGTTAAITGALGAGTGFVGLYMAMLKAGEGLGCGDGGGTCDTEDLSWTTVRGVMATGGVLLGISLLSVVVYASEAAPPAPPTATARAPTERELADMNRAMALAAQRAEQQRMARERAVQERNRRSDREQALALLKDSQQAARSGDCTTAIKLGDQIRALDANVHEAWFVRDDAIKQCLEAPTAPPPPGGALMPVVPEVP